jgi:hypothetical protein
MGEQLRAKVLTRVETFPELGFQALPTTDAEFPHEPELVTEGAKLALAWEYGGVTAAADRQGRATSAIATRNTDSIPVRCRLRRGGRFDLACGSIRGNPPVGVGILRLGELRFMTRSAMPNHVLY